MVGLRTCMQASCRHSVGSRSSDNNRTSSVVFLVLLLLLLLRQYIIGMHQTNGQPTHMTGMVGKIRTWVRLMTR